MQAQEVRGLGEVECVHHRNNLGWAQLGALLLMRCTGRGGVGSAAQWGRRAVRLDPAA